jgi:DNA primase
VAAFSEAVLQDILAKTDLVSLVGEYVSLKPNGPRHWGLCPFHHEKSPSFTVNGANQFFYCFGCQEKGNAFGFLMKIEHLPFPEAVRKLADKAGILLAETEESPQDKERMAITEVLSRLTKTFHHLLLNHPEAAGARDLLASRGVSAEMIETFQVGYALRERGWMKKFLVERKYDQAFLAKTGLFSANNPDAFLFSGRLVFPIRFPTHETVGFGGRLLVGDGPKYINSPETPVFLKRRMLYAWDKALPKIREKQQVILCEGYMDAIALHQAGLGWAVAPLGTAFTEDQAKLLQRAARTVVCLFDADEAGQKAAAKAIEICEPLGLETLVARTKGSKDPSELLEKEGPEAVQALLASPQKGFDFLLDFRYNAFTRDSGLDVRGFVGEIFGFLSRLDNGVQRETFLNRMAEYLGVQKDTLAGDFAKNDHRRTDRALEARKEASRPRVSATGRTVEWSLVVTVVSSPDQFGVLRRNLSPEDFEEERCRVLLEILEAMVGEGRTAFSLDEVLTRLDDDVWGAELVKDVMSGEYQSNAAQVVKDGVLKMREKNLLAQRRKVLGRLEKAATDEERTRLLQEHKFLGEEITRLKGND